MDRMRCDAPGLRLGAAQQSQAVGRQGRRGRQGRQGAWALHMPTELKPAVWGTSSMSHPLTGTLEELVTASLRVAIGHSGPCQPDAP